MKRWEKALRTAGLIFTAYGLLVLLLLGPGYWFNYAFLAAGSALLFTFRMRARLFPPRGILRVIACLLCLCLLLFLAFEIRILFFPLVPAAPNADYVLLLGCQVRGATPSLDYAARIRRAAEYLSANPRSRLVACGGQGDREDLSEAEAARRILIRDYGIGPERILTEEESTSTLENLLFAAQLIRADGGSLCEDTFVIVSSSYHLFRAVDTAKDLGYRNISACGRNGILFLLPHYYCREFAAYAKYLLFTRPSVLPMP